jgi:DNA-directed RNA polymerase specialized sigma24 family protein
MSKMAELDYDIEQLFIDGLTAKQIAEQLDCPIEIVQGWIDGVTREMDEFEPPELEVYDLEEVYSPYLG